MAADRVQWVTAATYASGFEADVAVASLEAMGVPARARANDTVGIFGPGFGGATARGVDVLVPAAALDVARDALAADVTPADDDDDDGYVDDDND
ncbi:MAG TPA: hypothetical protein VFJ74_14945 [Gemmatimonadaceae bacterium]|nr:hypothetical protein [Gemmatimonadaceae bacterium]